MKQETLKAQMTPREELRPRTSARPGPVKTKIVFIVSKFPCYDEAFILRELDAVASEHDVTIFSLRHSKENIVHEQAKSLLPNTLYVPYLFSAEVLAANLQTMLFHPLRYFGSLGSLILGNLKSPQFLFKGLAFFPKSVYLGAWIKKNGVTHIHAYWATYPASAARVASAISGVPYSFTGHAHDIYLDTTQLKEKIEGAVFVSTCTAHNKEYLCKLAPQVPVSRIFLNYHGLDLKKFELPEKKRNETFEILSVGTLNPHKGFGYLLEALDLLGRKGISFHCTIIGGGPLEAQLKAQIESLNLQDKVTMTGPLKQGQVIPYYKKADLKVLMAQPEWHWGIPNVLIEALAAKVPVITTAFGSVEELIQDKKTGILVPPKDSQALADAVEKLYKDETLRLQYMEAGRRFVLENFDISKNIRGFISRLTQDYGAGKS